MAFLEPRLLEHLENGITQILTSILDVQISSYSVNHFNFMNKTLIGRLWAPIAKWFTILEMRLHLDIFRQQGLVMYFLFRLLKTDFSTLISIWEEMYYSNTLPDKRKIVFIKPSPLSLDPKNKKKRKILQNWLCNSWIFRPWALQGWSIHSNICWIPQTSILMG